MEKFFQKYKHSPTEEDAIRMIRGKVDESKHHFRSEKNDEYIKRLLEVREMIDDILELKGVNPSNYTHR